LNQILENIKSRRSIRAFTDEPIDPVDLDRILEAGLWAPSARGLQTWQFTVLTDRTRISELAVAIAEQLQRDPSRYTMYEPTALILASNDRENHNGMLDCSCALQNMFLAAHSLGLGSVWINQLRGICDEAGIRPILDSLGIPPNHLVWGMAALGHPAGPAPEPPPRKGVVHYVK
jgi:nitroreductase